MIFKARKWVEHNFKDETCININGYNIPIELDIKFAIPDNYREAEDDPDYIAKNIRRFNRIDDRYDDLPSFVDVYLENYDKGSYGFILNPCKKIPTVEYILNEGCISIKEKYIGNHFYTIYQTCKTHTVYVTSLSNNVKYIVNVVNTNHNIREKELMRILKFEYEYSEKE